MVRVAKWKFVPLELYLSRVGIHVNAKCIFTVSYGKSAKIQHWHSIVWTEKGRWTDRISPFKKNKMQRRNFVIESNTAQDRIHSLEQKRNQIKPKQHKKNKTHSVVQSVNLEITDALWFWGICSSQTILILGLLSKISNEKKYSYLCIFLLGSNIRDQRSDILIFEKEPFLLQLETCGIHICLSPEFSSWKAVPGHYCIWERMRTSFAMGESGSYIQNYFPVIGSNSALKANFTVFLNLNNCVELQVLWEKYYKMGYMT